MIGSSADTVLSVIPSKTARPPVDHSETFMIRQLRSIEDNVRATCGELVYECVVVGNGRPSPALFVEASEELKEEIIRRMNEFNSRRFVHESITSTKHVIVIERGTLPRTATKGNVRRRAVEDQYKELLDEIYDTVQKH